MAAQDGQQGDQIPQEGQLPQQAPQPQHVPQIDPNDPNVVAQMMQFLQATAQQVHLQQQTLFQNQTELQRNLMAQTQQTQMHRDKFKFPPPKPFDGKEEEFETFATKFKSFMGSYNPKFYTYMNYIQEHHDDPIDLNNWMQSDAECRTLAGQLQYALINVLSGVPFRMVMHYSEGNIHTSGNGLESWRQLVIRYDKLKRVRASSTLLNILTWAFKSGRDFETSFLEWEQEVAKFYVEHSMTPIQDFLKVGLILTRLSGQLRNLLFLNTTVDTPYHQVRQQILNYIKS
ncbi:MAG: hypothetical protein GY768_10580, partial [Planctomycetaceae bacterium]|nr:hypothetical protein [Planctomycetaceae bacterium]